MIAHRFAHLWAAALCPLLLLASTAAFADDIDRDGRDDGVLRVDANGDGLDGATALPALETVTATLIIHRQMPWALTGLYRTTQWSPELYNLQRRIIDWYTGGSLPDTTNILLFTYNGDIEPPVDEFEVDGLALYQWLVATGYQVRVQAQWDIETLSVTFMQGSDLIIYWNSYGYDPQRALESGVPFLTMARTHGGAMDIVVPQFASSELRSTVCVREAYGPTATLPTGILDFVTPSFTHGYLPVDNGRPLLTNKCGLLPGPFDIVHFGADVHTVEPFGTVTLDWEVVGDADVSIDGFGLVTSSGALTTQPERSRVYVLRAVQGAIEKTAEVSVSVPDVGVRAGFIGPSWSPVEWPGTAPTLLPLQPFEFHVLAIDPPGGIDDYEFSVHLPPCFTVFERTIYPIESAIDLGNGDDNFIVGTGGACLMGPTVPLVSYRAAALDASCLAAGGFLDVAGSTPSSLIPPAAGYLPCGGGEAERRFMVASPLPVVADPATWVSIVRFEADPTELQYGETGRLFWESEYATRAEIDQHGLTDLPPSGSVVIDPAGTVDYKLTVANAFTSASRSLTVTKLPFAIISFTADRDTVAPLESITLTWEVAGEAEVVLEGFGVVSPAGSVVTQPERSRTYVLRVTNGGFTRTAQTSVVASTDGVLEGLLGLSWLPDRIPGVPPVITPNQAFDFFVVALAPPDGVQNYEFAVELPACLLVQQRELYPQPGGTDIGSGADNWIVATGGACLAAPAIALVRYSALVTSDACLGPGMKIELRGSNPSSFVPPAPSYATCSGQLRHFIVAPALPLDPSGGVADPVISRFSAEPSYLPVGQVGSLVWETSGAEELVIQPGDYHDLPATGSLAVDPQQTTTYALTARNARGTRSATTTMVRAPFLIRSFAASDYSIAAGDSSLLSWQVDGVAEVAIDPLGPQPMSGSRMVRPSATTVYTLRARSGSDEDTVQLTIHVGSGPMGTAGFYLSWSGEEVPGQSPTVEPFTGFDFWVHAVEADGGISAYECSVQNPVGLIVTGGREIFPQRAFDFGAGEDNFIVGTGGLCMQGALMPLICYHACLFLGTIPSDQSISLGPALPSSFPQTQSPGYLTCGAIGDLRPAPAGPPLLLNELGGPTVPALIVEATAESNPNGILLSWRMLPRRSVTATRILRRDARGDFREIAVLAEGDASASGSWLDATGVAGEDYVYVVLLTIDEGVAASREVRATRPGQPAPVVRSGLHSVVPNPFNPRAEIRFAVTAPVACALEIFNAAGQRVRSVRLGQLAPGAHAWIWNGQDEAGRQVSSGVYRVRLSAGESVTTLAATLVR